MKKLLSIFAAASVLFGLASCSGDLHDVEESPYDSTDVVYVLGGISASTIDTATYPSSSFADTTAYKINVKEGKIKFEFTYSGNDSWSAGSGNTAFAIVADVTKDWDTANKTRWMSSKDGITVGSEGVLSQGSSNNVTLKGLNAGTTYTVEADLTSVGGTLKVTEGLAAVPFELIWIDDDGKLTNATSITAVNNTTFTYEVTPEDKAKTIKFIARYGNTYYFPAAEATFTVDGATTAEADAKDSSDGFKALKVVIPNVKDSGTVKSYKIFMNLDTSKVTASVRKIYNAPDETVKAVNSGLGNYTIEWAEPKEVSCDEYVDNSGDEPVTRPCGGKLVYTGTVTVAKGKVPNWGCAGFAFGITADINDWSTKYTGAVLETSGTLVATKVDDGTNNYISATGYAVDSDLSKDIVLTITADVYQNVYANGKYENKFDNTSVKVSFKDAE